MAPASKPATRFRTAQADRPWPIGVANCLLGWTRGFVPFDAATLIARGVRAVPGSQPGDLAFQTELKTLCTAIRSEANLSFAGHIAARDDTARLVRTHLRVQRALAEHALPTALPPIFIVGWPRSGTSHLLGLLAQDPAHRSLRYYESFDPAPAGGPPEPDGADPRIARLGRLLRGLDWLSPHYQSIHAMEPDDPEECVALFMNAFRTLQFEIQYRVPSYTAHLLRTSPRAAYTFYRDQLRLVQAATPSGERWILKDPTHLFALDVIADLFPDARIVHIHRDPVTALGSICSLYAHTRALFSDDVDPTLLGPEVLGSFWADGLERSRTFRHAHPSIPVADVRYDDLVRDPLATLTTLYADLGLTLTEPARAAMVRYLGQHPQHPTRVHRYSLAQFGLRPDAIRERFTDYRQRFAFTEASENSPTTTGRLTDENGDVR